MALIKCTGCGKMISDKARKCNGCGMAIEEILNGTSYIKESIEEVVIENKEEISKVKAEVITENKIPKNLNNNLIIGIVVAVIVWSIILISVVNSSFNKKLEKVLALAETSNMMVQQNESVGEKQIGEASEEVENDKLEVETEKQGKVTTNQEKLAEGVTFTSEREDIEVVLTKSTWDYYGLDIYFLITNRGDETINIETRSSHYLNNVSIYRYLSEMTTKIPAGKSIQLKLTFDIDDLEAALQENIHVMELRMYSNDNEDETITFYSDKLDIPWKE